MSHLQGRTEVRTELFKQKQNLEKRTYCTSNEALSHINVLFVTLFSAYLALRDYQNKFRSWPWEIDGRRHHPKRTNNIPTSLYSRRLALSGESVEGIIIHGANVSIFSSLYGARISLWPVEGSGKWYSITLMDSRVDLCSARLERRSKMTARSLSRFGREEERIKLKDNVIESKCWVNIGKGHGWFDLL